MSVTAVSLSLIWLRHSGLERSCEEAQISVYREPHGKSHVGVMAPIADVNENTSTHRSPATFNSSQLGLRALQSRRMVPWFSLSEFMISESGSITDSSSLPLHFEGFVVFMIIHTATTV